MTVRGAADPSAPLDLATIETACGVLADRDPVLGRLFGRNGVPPLWRRPAEFSTLVRLILEQQVSLASGAAAYHRLRERIGEVRPAPFLTLDDDELRGVGFSRQKTRYVRLLAEALETGELDLRALDEAPDGDAMATLTQLVGIGPWTAANYLLFGLGRPDIWPRGDRALLVSLGRTRTTETPDDDTAERLAREWAPWRSVAARLLWHDYLGGPAYDPSGF